MIDCATKTMLLNLIASLTTHTNVTQRDAGIPIINETGIHTLKTFIRGLPETEKGD